MQHSFEYKIGKYRLTINIWFLIIFLLLQTLLNELGFWQLSRAQEKQKRIDILASDSRFQNNLDSLNENLVNRFSRVKLTVRLAEHINLLVENKIQGGKLGYHVLNLVEEPQSGHFVLVNRGWIEGKAKRSELPTVNLPPIDWDIEARVYPINQQIFSSDAEIEMFAKTIRLPVLDVHILSILENKFGVPIKPYLLRLNKGVISSLEIEWGWINMSPEKHLGYAFQWFGLALAFLIASLFVLIKKEK